MRTGCAAVVLVMYSLAIIACTAHARSPEPVPVDRVECARCRMLISSDSGGGEIVSIQDDTRFYDDIRCLAADWPLHHDDARAYVRIAGGRWSEAHAASYAQVDGARTAMGSGIAAFATPADARAADRAGRALTFDEVIQLSGEPR